MVTPSGTWDAGMVLPTVAEALATGAFAGALVAVLAGVAFVEGAFAGALVAAFAGVAFAVAGFAATFVAEGADFAVGAASFAGAAFAVGTFTLCMDGPFFSVAGALAVAVYLLISSVFFLLNNPITDLHIIVIIFLI